MKKEKSMKRILALMGFLSMIVGFANPALASSQRGKIVELNVRTDGLIWFTLEGTRANKPACAAYEYWIIKDENSVVGKNQYSLLLSALVSGRSVTIYGENACNRWSDGETVLQVQMKQ